jgi:WD40 repeat protein
VGSDTGIFVYDAFTFSLRNHFETGERINYLAVHPDGQMIALGGDPDNYQNITLWNLRTGTPVKTLSGITGDIATDISYSPDGNLLASGTNNGKVQLWDLNTGTLRQDLLASDPCCNRFIRHVLFSRDGTLIVAGDDFGTIRLFNTESGQQVLSITGKFNSILDSLDISSENRWVAATGLLGNSDRVAVMIFDTRNGKVVYQSPEIAGRGSYNFLSFSPINSSLIVGSCRNYGHWSDTCSQGWVEIWNPQIGFQPQLIKEYKGVPVAGNYSPDGKQFGVLTGDLEPVIDFFDVEKDQVIKTIEWYQGPTTPPVFTRDSKMVITGDPDGKIRFWKTDTGALVKTLGNEDYPISNLALNPEGTLLAAAVSWGDIVLWDLRTSITRTIPVRELISIPDLQFSNNGRWLVWIESDDGKYQVYRYNLVSQVKESITDIPYMDHIAISPDSTMVAIGTYLKSGGNISVFDLITGDLLWKASASDEVTSVAFNPDGTILAAGSYDQRVEYWDTASHNEIQNFPVISHFYEFGAEVAIAFFPKQPIMVSAVAGNIRFWSIPEYRQVLEYEKRYYSDADEISISPDGKVMATRSINGTVLLWQVGGLE